MFWLYEQRPREDRGTKTQIGKRVRAVHYKARGPSGAPSAQDNQSADANCLFPSTDLRSVKLIPKDEVFRSLKEDRIVKIFLITLLAGFAAQMIDGTLGMAYGVSSSTLLRAMGIPSAMSSFCTHVAEIFTTLASGISHVKMKNFSL